MAESWQIRIYDQQQSVYSGEISGRVELGRQGDSGERLYSKKYLEAEGRWRLVVASRDEDSVSRRHALLEPAGKGRLRLVNLSAKVAIRLQDGTDLAPNAASELALPAVLTLGRKIVRILEHAPDDFQYQRLPEIESSPGSPLATPSGMSAMTIALPVGGNINTEEILDWLKGAMIVLQSAASSTDFFEAAARVMVETVGLDTGRVVLLKGDDWQTVAAWSPKGPMTDLDQVPSRNVLARVRNDRCTLWHVPETAPSGGTDSLIGISAVVASPILVKGEVIGAMYGDRRRSASPGQPPRISKVEAMFVDVLTASVAAGLARLESEKAAVAAKVQFEQFFTPDLARVIAERPELLKGQESEITLVFADIRGFSRISEHLGPAKTVSWMNEVMGILSDCVLAHRGVLVNYIGDELMAMWGAPEEQPDHAKLACRAALDMINLLPELNARFIGEIGETMDLGIGINTGIARVGNTGSKHKFQYGPLGNTVNMASRVQGVTKYLKVRLLVTEATHRMLDAEFPSRRIGKVRVVNITEPTNLYEISAPNSPQWEPMCLEYESALAEFERKGFRMASRILGRLVNEHPEDGPSIVLLSRAVNGLVDPEAFDPIFVAPGK